MWRVVGGRRVHVRGVTTGKRYTTRERERERGPKQDVIATQETLFEAGERTVDPQDSSGE
jgi:uncharacterized NAD-dependent epimerase/dehydratase family protein